MLEDQIKTSNEESIKRNIDIVKTYAKVIHILVIISKIQIIVSGLLSFISTKFDYWLTLTLPMSPIGDMKSEVFCPAA